MYRVYSIHLRSVQSFFLKGAPEDVPDVRPPHLPQVQELNYHRSQRQQLN